MPDWTEQQWNAINRTDGAICVVAGAGAGKTGVIVARFLRLVQEGHAAADQILTITYTEKAAQEMKRRIVEQLEKAGLLEERRRVEYAYIHTIHGLCRRLLAENPFEAGIDPQFRIVDARDANRIRRSSFDAAVQEAMMGEGPMQKLIATSPTMPVFGGDRDDLLDPLHRVVTNLLEKIRSFGMPLQELERWAEQAATEANEASPGALLRLKAATETGLRNALATTTDPMLLGLAREIERLPDPSEKGGEAWIAAARELLSVITQTAKSQKVFTFDNQEVALLRTDLTQFKLPKEQEVAQLVAALLQLTALTWQGYEERKLETARIDFDDLQERTLRLLTERDNVRRRYRERFRFIMVDEFQDVNPMQGRLMEALGAEGNWMIVGDERQAIYGFRHADVDFFRRHIAEIRAKNEQDPTAAHFLSLMENFRSRPEILAFVAKVFQPRWGEEYIPLTPRAAVLERKSPCVEVVFAEADGLANEAKALALSIKHWLDKGKCMVKEGDDERPARYGDIAVLLRQFTGLREFETAMVEAGIPYFISGGGNGYYTRYEVRDVKNALLSLARPDNDLALACLLRSPMVGLSVDALVVLTHAAHEKGTLLLDALDTPGELSEEDRTKLIEFREWFGPLRRVADRLSVATIIERVLAETQYDAKLLCREHGARQLANVRKLIQMSLETPEVSLFDFAERIASLERVRQREGDAPTHDERSNVVRFITMHSAKGLEFPIVALVDLNRGQRSRDDNRFEADIRRRELGLNWRGYKSYDWQRVMRREKEREEDEQLRLLYVAMTRAKEQLTLIMPHSQRSGTYAQFLYGALRLAPVGPALEKVNFTDDYLMTVRRLKATTPAGGPAKPDFPLRRR